MITYLRVRNIAIVEELAIEPGPGLNVLTGETGAGKSLLIDSLEFLRGARGSTDSIRTGCDKMSAEATFHLPASLGTLLASAGIEAETLPDGSIEIIARRELSAAGRGRVLLNGSALTVRELVDAMDRVIEIHGQEGARDRVAGQSARELIDLYGGHDEHLGRVRHAYHQWDATSTELRKLSSAHSDRALRLDLLRYQIDEISSAKLDSSEEETLRSERAILANAQEMIAASSAAFSLLDDDEQSALAQISRAQQHLQSLARKIDELKKVSADLDDVRFRLQDAAGALSALSDRVRHDPARLDEIEERLAAIDRLKKKYGGSIPAVLEHLDAISVEFAQLDQYESSVEKLQSEESKAFDAYQSAALQLSKKRMTAAESLQRAIQTELADLAMERTSMRIDCSTANERDSRMSLEGQPVAFGAEGYDRIEILIAPNRGEELRPLSKIASGGELSRMQLAIAAALFKSSDHQGVATLVFDEIDAGIGGRVAETVGLKLRELSERNQVICVTHLPQIASVGMTHFRVWKEDVGGRTQARIERLDTREERIVEIARMLGAERAGDSARAHAAQLLEAAATPPPRRRGAARASS